MSDSVSELDLESGEGHPDDPAPMGVAARTRRHAQRPGPARLDALRGRRRRQRPGRDRPRTGPRPRLPPRGLFPHRGRTRHDGKTAFVLNTKGNGSVSKTTLGKPGNAHDFQGTVTVVDLSNDLARETELVARNNRWDANPGRPSLEGLQRGDPARPLHHQGKPHVRRDLRRPARPATATRSLCSLGEKIMPNHRKIAREFTLFDNGYVSGTNSADGHAWSTQCLANDYLEHFYVGYSRTYPDDGDCAMSISNGGALWDAALKKGRTVRVWGEFCDDKLATYDPQPKDWFEVWEDRVKGTHRFKFTADTTVASLKPLINREVHYWPLAPERPVPRRRIHSRIRSVQPRRHGTRPDDHEPAVRPHRGDRPQISRPRAR